MRGAAAADPDLAEVLEHREVGGIVGDERAGEVLVGKECLAGEQLAAAALLPRLGTAAHNVRFHRTGIKRFHHPVVGDLTLTYEPLDQAGHSPDRTAPHRTA